MKYDAEGADIRRLEVGMSFLGLRGMYSRCPNTSILIRVIECTHMNNIPPSHPVPSRSCGRQRGHGRGRR